VNGALNVYNVTALPKAQLREGLACLERAIDLAKRSGCKVECHSGLLESIKEKLNEPEQGSNPLHVIGSRVSWGAPSLPKGMTRDCADPWKFASLFAEGEVHPCCAYGYSIGDLRKEPLVQILNGPRVKQLRRDLLTGNLQGHLCSECSMKPQIPVAEFRRRMSGRLVLWSLRRRLLNLISGDFTIRKPRKPAGEQPAREQEGPLTDVSSCV
jgi:hypothetical protein